MFKSGPTCTNPSQRKLLRANLEIGTKIWNERDVAVRRAFDAENKKHPPEYCAAGDVDCETHKLKAVNAWMSAWAAANPPPRAPNIDASDIEKHPLGDCVPGDVDCVTRRQKSGNFWMRQQLDALAERQRREGLPASSPVAEEQRQRVIAAWQHDAEVRAARDRVMQQLAQQARLPRCTAEEISAQLGGPGQINTERRNLPSREDAYLLVAFKAGVAGNSRLCRAQPDAGRAAPG